MPFPAGYHQPGIPDARSLRYPGSPEVALNQKVKNLIQKLGEAIHETVSESEDIAVVVKNIREQGFDVLLMLEATIGLNEVEGGTEEVAEETTEVEGPFSSGDLTFLKSLRISVNESDDTRET
jgi:translation elongation factor EF-1beta